MTEREGVMVWAVEEPTVLQVSASFVCEDPRSNDNGSVDAHVEMDLSNGRRLLICSTGVWDMDDVDGRPLHEVNGAAFVPWEELLQLLDAWREMNRQMRVN